MRTLLPRIDATVLGAASLLAIAMGGGSSTDPVQRFDTVAPQQVAVTAGASGFVGVWLSDDDRVRLDVAPDGTYERSVAGRRKSARGLYRVVGDELHLQDESGVRTTVTSTDGHLEMAGHTLSKI